jgi:hypothetical protein
MPERSEYSAVMKPLRSLTVLTLVALAAAVALTPTAATAAPARNLPASPEAEFEVAGTHGFLVHFSVSKGSVAAVATKGPDLVSYRAHGGEAADGRFAGTFPGIGRVAVRFHQHGKTKRVTILCPKAPTLARPGFFVGTIRLRGEQGYTEVRGTRAEGTLAETPGPKCNPRQKPRQPTLLRAGKPGKSKFLSIQAKAGNVEVLAGQSSGGKVSLSILGALRSHHHDGMLVENAVLQFGSAPTILPSEDVDFPKTATVAPGAPFSGSATFEFSDTKTSTWTGDLAVELPGVGRVSLAGPRYRSHLCSGKRCVGSLPPEPGSQ